MSCVLLAMYQVCSSSTIAWSRMLGVSSWFKSGPFSSDAGSLFSFLGVVALLLGKLYPSALAGWLTDVFLILNLS